MTLKAYFTIFISFILGILLMILPVAPWLTDLWPIWIIPIIFYWLMALPHRVGLTAAFMSGLLLDILLNSLIGTHALALLVVSALFRKIARRFSFFSMAEQILILLLFSGFYSIIISCVEFLNIKLFYFNIWSILTTGLIWPLIYLILRYYRRYFYLT